MRIVYLHGFASSPQSSKARFFAEKFGELGVPFDAPALDGGNFEGLTITGQLGVVDRAVGAAPVVLMGSSLGGYVAALYAARHAEVEKLVLLAPAFQFPTRWRARYSAEELERWRERGTIPFFHYGYKEERGLGFQIVADSAQYEEVPAELSKGFAARHTNVQLKLLDSGHELTDVLDRMWLETAGFLGFQSS
jgi:uncharacterized protein